MLYALIEGLAGVEDKSRLFETARISPRWLAAGIEKADVQVCYENAGIGISYSIHYSDEDLRMEMFAPHSDVAFHVLLPAKSRASHVRVNRIEREFSSSRIRRSNYVDFEAEIRGSAEIVIQLQSAHTTG
jgi:hypothetical protein